MTINFLRCSGGEGGSKNVDILGGVVTKWWYLFGKGGGGVKNLGKSDYVIGEYF